MNTTELHVTGMTCQHCQKAVKEALESVDGVRHADVNLETGLAHVQGSAELNQLVAAVTEEGYEASAKG